MLDLATVLPCRRPELVFRPSGPDGSCLVRNRLKGESFALGPEEHFLLERLDGSRTADQLCAAFADIPESALPVGRTAVTEIGQITSRTEREVPHETATR
jgi:hypothetical protein